MKSMSVKVMTVLMCLAACFHYVKPVSAAKQTDSAEEYLAGTGMPVQEIEALDNDIRQFIADDLRNSGGKDWKINTDILTLTKTSSEQYTVAFYINVFAFRTASEYRIYAVYESSMGIMPAGEDSLMLKTGDGFIPCEYGGRIWYKRAGDDSWIQGGGLTADYRTTGGATFAGKQLGDFQHKMLVKGCVYCHADGGTGDDRRVVVDYTYKPARRHNGTGLYIMIVAVTVIIVLILRKKE